jgi:hypothetical protein
MSRTGQYSAKYCRTVIKLVLWIECVTLCVKWVISILKWTLNIWTLYTEPRPACILLHPISCFHAKIAEILKVKTKRVDRERTEAIGRKGKNLPIIRLTNNQSCATARPTGPLQEMKASSSCTICYRHFLVLTADTAVTIGKARLCDVFAIVNLFWIVFICIYLAVRALIFPSKTQPMQEILYCKECLCWC